VLFTGQHQCPEFDCPTDCRRSLMFCFVCSKTRNGAKNFQTKLHAVKAEPRPKK
jgi:hypothetical protein